MHGSVNSVSKDVIHLPLTSGQKWCMDEMLKIKRPGWYNIEFLVKTKVVMNESAIRDSVYYLVNKFESLRVRIISKDGDWLQEVYPLSKADTFAVHDLTHERGGHSSKRDKVKEICIRERDALLPERGNLARIIFFRFSENEGRLWFCFHHLVSDFVSVLIFSGEFMAAYNSIIHGKELKWQVLKDYRKWLYLLEGYCRDILLPAELEYWMSLPWSRAKLLPTDYPERFYNDSIVINAIRDKTINDSFREHTAWMDQDMTLKLFNRAGAVFEDILIAVFFLAISNTMQMDWLDINVCNAGRNILPPDYGINVNNLVGFLATSRAMLLKKPVCGNLDLDLQNVIEQIGNIPHGGIGFIQVGCRIKDDQIRNSYFSCRQRAEIFFNYLGRVNTSFSSELYESVEEDTGFGLHEMEVRNNLLDCEAGIRQNQLFLKITYPEVYFKASTIDDVINKMIDMLREIVPENILNKVA